MGGDLTWRGFKWSFDGLYHARRGDEPLKTWRRDTRKTEQHTLFVGMASKVYRLKH
jgi:hypothetical protein